ncbi:MAG TPA: TonB family protein, partial [Opitutaceae bacterium]|nr:TonB family protein [Opitutaceae bacterium]
HEGGTVPRANLLEIVAFAIGGRDMDQASAEVQEPLHHLLDFLMSVQRKPWNQPPGESRLHLAPLPMANPSEAESGSEETPATPPAGAGAAAAPAGKVIPITARHAAEPAAPAQPAPAQSAAEPTGQEPGQSANPARPFTRREGVFSRLRHFETEAGAAAADPLPEPEFAGAPSPVPEPIPPPPPPPPVQVTPVAAVAPEALRPVPQPRAAMLRPPSALDPEPPSPSYHAAMHLPIALPSLHLPRIPKVALPAWSRAHTRIVLLSAAGAALFIAVLVAASHSRPAAAVPIAQQRPPVSPALPKPSVAGSAEPAASTVLPAKPSAYGPALAHPQTRVVRQSAGYDDDGYVAKPYSTPVPGQISNPISSAAAPPPAAAASAPQASPIRPAVLTPVSAQPAARVPDRPIDPDATYVGAAGASAGEAIPLPRRPASVASAVMAANLLSAPRPGYPMLAKVAHIEGPVVVRAEVDRSGRVTDVSVLSGHHLLRGAAVDAVRQWRYRPYLVDGAPAPVFTTITLHFPPKR